MPSFASAVRDSLDVFAAFVALGLTFTAISLSASPLEVRVGTLRPLSTIPLHEFALIGTGLAISFVVMVGLRRFDLSTLLLSASFIVFLDLDHLPSALGIAQPIRPAHSLVFLAVLLVILTFFFKKPAKVQLTVAASFLGHLAVDTGTFPLLAPLSYAYYSLSSVDLALFVSTALIALLAGYFGRRRHESLLNPESPRPEAGGPTLSAVIMTTGGGQGVNSALRAQKGMNFEFIRVNAAFTRLK